MTMTFKNVWVQYTEIFDRIKYQKKECRKIKNSFHFLFFNMVPNLDLTFGIIRTYVDVDCQKQNKEFVDGISGLIDWDIEIL